MTYQEALDFLFKQLPMYQREGKTAYKKDLGNTLALCKKLDNPQQKFKSVHIAGTNGKGSVAHMLASMFQTAGYKTGLYTSPHLKDFRERIRINGKMIQEEKVIEFIQENQDSFEGIQPSFFEWTVALAFHHFATNEVDIAIIETGLGGRLDSTNVINPELSVITNIGFDHMEFLGDTLDKIAGEKAGIIKASTPVVIGNDCGQAKVFNQKANTENAPIHYAKEIDLKVALESDLKGYYQMENAKTAYAAWLQLRQLKWEISYPQFLDGLRNVTKNTGLKGRWQILGNKPKIVADTAHNQEGLSIVMKQLQEEPHQKLHIVLGMVKEKQLDKILSLFPKNANYYFCQAKIPRALSLETLKEEAAKNGLNGIGYSSVSEALEAAKTQATEDDLIYVGGSTFVVAEVL